jgi:hypothetical protein
LFGVHVNCSGRSLLKYTEAEKRDVGTLTYDQE